MKVKNMYLSCHRNAVDILTHAYPATEMFKYSANPAVEMFTNILHIMPWKC